ncbi:MAG TPA: hypothetical protein VJ952_03370 [Opitutales bacterium]|nr:hypothetical protein [Opitutales bacterium]
MKPITLERLQSLAAARPTDASTPEATEKDECDMAEPLLSNGMSDEFRAFLDDEEQIDTVLSESLELLD